MTSPAKSTKYAYENDDELIDVEEWPDDEDLIDSSINNVLLVISQENPELYKIITDYLQ